MDFIESYKGPNINCYQNLLLANLQQYGFNIDLFSAIWPWSFKIENNNLDFPFINNIKVVTKEKLKRLLNIDLLQEDVRNGIEKINISTYPAIVYVDQYYIPFHYPHIYQKVHGPHNLLLIKQEEYGFVCYDTLPSYYGIIEKECLFESIENYPYSIRKYVYERFEISNAQEASMSSVISEFKSLLFQVNMGFQSNKIDASKGFITSKEFFTLIEIKKNSLSKEDYLVWMSNVFESIWVWEFNRLPAVLKNILNHCLSVKQGDVFLLIDKIRDTYDNIFKNYIKGLMKRDIDTIEKANTIFKMNIETERKLIQYLSTLL